MIKNILVVRNDRFGEFLLNIPAIQALRERYPQAKISLAVGSGVVELAGLAACADRALAWDEIKSGLRKYNFDLCVVLNPTRQAHVSCFLAGIPIRVGYDRKWGFLLTRRLKDTKRFGNRHEVDCNLELVGLAGAKTFNRAPGVKVDENLFREFIGRKIIAIHPFTSDPVKQWPVERFGELALRIKNELGIKVVVVGKNDEIVSSSGVGGLLATTDDKRSGNDVRDESVVNMINQTSLPELAAVLKRCSLLVSCDSGPVHLAAAVGTPVLALFRNDLPGKTAKRWGPWGEGHMVIEKSKLEDISADEVFFKVKERVKI